MKNLLDIRFLLISVICTLIMGFQNNEAHAQEYINTPVEISTEKVKINGEICYSHIVLERQTLFSISKAYEVSIEDIYRLNPTIKEEGLKKNAILLIPSNEVRETKDTKDTKDTKESKNIKVKEEKKTIKTEVQGLFENAPRLHVARWYEDLESIAELYKVRVEDIMKKNNLTGRKLFKGQKLMIPYQGEVISEPEEEEISSVSEDTIEVEDTIGVYSALDFFSRFFVKRVPVNATVILPLSTQNDTPNSRNMDFYCGALLGVYDMANNGIDCNLEVLDMMDEETPVSIESFQNKDIIIGPASEADLTRMITVIPDAEAIISPLDPRAYSLVQNHPNIIHIPTPHNNQYIDLINWLNEEYSPLDKIIFITEKGARDTELSKTLKTELEKTGKEFIPFSYSILEGREITEPLTNIMTADGVNRIVVASDSEAFVNDVVRNINLLIYNKMNIVLYAPAKIRGFENIEVVNLHNASLHISLGYNIDYNSEEVRNFILKYRALYGTEPSQHAFQGYDITCYFLNLFSKYGDEWKEHIEHSSKPMLQSTFSFKKQGYGGYANSGVRRVVYEDDYIIRQVK